VKILDNRLIFGISPKLTRIQKMSLLIFNGCYRATSSNKLPKKILSVNHQKGGKIDKTCTLRKHTNPKLGLFLMNSITHDLNHT